VRLAKAAEAMGHRAGLVAPLTDALVELRGAARRDRDWAAADAIRESLDALGVELHDSDAGTTWSLTKPESS
jgi:cysteinyl-tRNA synthetase